MVLGNKTPSEFYHFAVNKGPMARLKSNIDLDHHSQTLQRKSQAMQLRERAVGRSKPDLCRSRQFSTLLHKVQIEFLASI